MTMYRQHSIGKRRFALVSASIYALTRGIAYIPPVRQTPVQEPILAAVGWYAPLVWVYVLAWIAVAIYCLCNLKDGRLLGPMMGLIGMMAAWGAAWFLGWLREPDTLYWQTAITYLGPAATIGALTVLTPKVERVRGDV